MATYQEFSRQIKEKYPQYKDVDDLKLAKAMIAKYPQYEKQVTFEEPKQTKKSNPAGDFVQGAIYGLTAPGTELGRKIGNKIREKMGKEPVTKEELSNMGVYKYTNKKPETFAGKAGDFVSSLGVGLLLPETKLIKGVGLGAKIGNSAITGAYQGGLLGGAESLKNEGDIKGSAPGAAIGTIIGGSIPVVGTVGKQAIKFVPKVGGTVAKTLGRLQPETLKRATTPGSKALDLTPEQAQNLLMNTTERVRGDYNSLLNQKGDTVGNLLKELPEDVNFKAKNLMDNYDSIYNSYSLSKNPELNPARNATKKELAKIENLVYGGENEEAQLLKDYTQKLKNLEFPKSYLEVLRNRYKNTYHTKTLDTLNNGIVKAQRKFNDEILGEIRKNPEILQNAEKIQELEQKVGNMANFPYDEVNQEFYNKFYSAIEGMPDKANITRTPKELYDINKNISDMINWDIPGTQTKNDVLEQMYLANAKKISDLSPALKKANKEYADLMDFQKNEGIRRILNNQNNIDTASSALKNYNSTVTKGNTNRNIQDLEKILTNEGYSPFLNDIDDVNAAMDLNNIRTTGDSFWANVGTAAARPLLRAARAYNSSNLPSIVNNVGRTLSPVQRAVVPVSVIGASPVLYGGVSNTDDEYYNY